MTVVMMTCRFKSSCSLVLGSRLSTISSLSKSARWSATRFHGRRVSFHGCWSGGCRLIQGSNGVLVDDQEIDVGNISIQYHLCGSWGFHVSKCPTAWSMMQEQHKTGSKDPGKGGKVSDGFGEDGRQRERRFSWQMFRIWREWKMQAGLRQGWRHQRSLPVRSRMRRRISSSLCDASAKWTWMVLDGRSSVRKKCFLNKVSAWLVTHNMRGSHGSRESRCHLTRTYEWLSVADSSGRGSFRQERSHFYDRQMGRR